MSLYPPPRENVPIFDSSNFTIDNSALTVDSGLDYFLAYPTAQGSQTMSNTTVAGTLTALGSANFTSTTLGSLTSSALQPPSNDSSTKIPTTAWVQTAVSGGGGAASTLSQVLLAGNSAGTTGINMNNNDILNIKVLEVDGAADFNSTVNVDGILTTTNEINMTGSSPSLGTIKSRQYRFNDINTGTLNTSAIYSTVNTLSIESYPANINNDSLTRFFVRNSSNIDIQALTITPTKCDISVPLDMTGGNSALSTIKCRGYNFKILGTGAATNSAIYLDNTNMVLDNQQSNSSMEFRTRTSGGGQVTSLRIESSQMFSNVPLDMTNNDVTLLGYLNASIRSRIYLFRDLTTAAITSCGMYFSSNILQIDSTSSSSSTATSMFLRTTKTDGTLTNALQLTNTTVKTDCYVATPLSINDNSNSIPTTTWVQSLVSSIPPIPSNIIRSAASAGNFTSAAGNQILGTVTIPLSGGSFLVPDPTNGWAQNQGVTFRVNYFQSFNARSSSPNDSQNYISFSGMLTFYPWRFQSIGWLNTVVSNGPRGRVSDNVIVTTDGNSNTNYVTLDSVCSAGRQFWSNDVSFQSNSSFNGRLFVYGGVTINDVIFELAKPNGYSAANEIYSYTFSIELVNESNTFSNITSNGFNVVNL